MPSFAKAAVFCLAFVAGMHAGRMYGGACLRLQTKWTSCCEAYLLLQSTVMILSGLVVSTAAAGDAFCHFGTLPGGWIKSQEGSPFPLYSEDGGTFPTWQPYSQDCQLKPLLGPYLQVCFSLMALPALQMALGRAFTQAQIL